MDVEFYTAEEFADVLKVQREQVYKWIKSGRIKALRVSDGPKSPYRIPSSEIYRLRSSAYDEKEGE